MLVAGRVLQQVAGHSDEVTIEHGESKGLSVCKLKYSEVFDVFDVVRCACGLFVRGPGKQHQPRRASTPSCCSVPAGKGGLEQGRSLLLIPVLSLSSSNPLRGTERSED